MLSPDRGTPFPPPSLEPFRARARGSKAAERSQLFADIFRNLPVGLVAWRLEDPEDLGSFRLVAANPASFRAVSAPAEELLGTTMTESLPAPLRTELAAQCADVIRSGREMDLGDLQYADGRVASVKAFPLPDRTVGLVFEDVTEHRRIQEQLRQGQRVQILGRLAAGIAHDFNNIVTAVMGYSELVLEMEIPERVRSHVHEIFDVARRAASLNRRLMAFGRQQVLQPRVLDLRVVVTGVEKMLRRLIGEDVAVLVGLPQELGRVKADVVQIEQVLMNLALNARDAMPRGGTLSFRLADVDRTEADVHDHEGARPGPHVLLAVSDTGVGMDPETLPHIFEPFFTTKPPGKGTGLGLATVDGIVRQSGGHVEVESEPGQGTTFRVYIPRVEETLDVAGPIDDSAPPTGSGTVLVVEDETPVRTLLRDGLETSGYRVLEAADPAAALRVSAEHPSPIDLVITDVVMLQMSGPELWANLASRRHGLKVLFVSGYNDDGTSDLLAEGANVLTKPFTRSALARKVRDVLNARR